MRIKLFIKTGNDIAEGLFLGKKMIVCKGSIISQKEPASSFSYAEVREDLMSKYTIKENDKIKLVEDIEFNSASTAANFCLGYSSNGLITWKDESGKTLKKILSEFE